MFPTANGILTQLPILDRLTSGGSPALAPITPPSTPTHPPTLPILPLIPIVPSQARRWDYLLNGAVIMILYPTRVSDEVGPLQHVWDWSILPVDIGNDED